MNNLTLHADDLLSKWGFDEGFVITEWWFDNHDPYAEPPDVDRAEVLYHLVDDYLRPVIEAAGYEVRLTTVGRHNPVRVSHVQGHAVDWTDWRNRFPERISVEVAPEQVESAFQLVADSRKADR